MPLDNLNLITVTGTWILANGDPGVGNVTFVPANDVILIDPATNEIVLPVPFVAELDVNGSISIDLPATDDPDLVPVGWAYTVLENIGTPALKNRSIYNMSLPLAGGPVDLSDVVPPGPDGATEFTYVTMPEFRNWVPDGGTAAQVLTADGAGGADWATPPSEAGLPAGGTADQVLAKIDETDYNVQWVTPAGGGGTDDQTAAEVPFTPDGDIAATNTQAAVVEVRDDAATALASHASDSTSVHGIADTADLIVEGDSRLTDARTPIAHTHDDRYYTEAEVDSALSGKSDTSHGHDHGALTGLTDDDHPQYPLIVNTDSDSGRTIYVGSVDPDVSYSPVAGDVWLDTSA